MINVTIAREFIDLLSVPGFPRTVRALSLANDAGSDSSAAFQNQSGAPSRNSETTPTQTSPFGRLLQRRLEQSCASSCMPNGGL